MNTKAAIALDHFQKFASANSLESILAHFHEFCHVLDLQPSIFPNFVSVIKETLTSSEIRDLLSKYENRIEKNKCYKNGNACKNSKVLIIGAGPCGLRTAIEAQLLGARVIVLEKRQEFTRNNILHLWPFVMTDLRELGAKRFCPKFCPGSIDHVSIHQLQSILLKISLTVGVEVFPGIEFTELIEPSEKNSWRAKTTADPDHPITNFEFDVIIGADGRQKVLPGFRRKELRAKLAIAITANFVNRRTAAEAKVEEISGVSFIFRQSLFTNLCEETGIDLENFVYYKDETHYFVMTAKKQSLLWKGVLKENYVETEDLLATDNIDMEALQAYVIETVEFLTRLPKLDFVVNSRGQPDLAIFDFTKIYAAENACRVLERHGRRLLMGLVGDCLLEPFWPTGSGCARGFLSSFDAAWMIRCWCRTAPEDVLEVIAEREAIYRLLAQTTHENLSKDHKNYTADPTTRYPNLVLGTVKPSQVAYLYDSDDPARKKIFPPSPVPAKPARRNKGRSKSPPPIPTHMESKPIRRTESMSMMNSRSSTPSQLSQKQNFDIDFLVDWFKEAVDKFGIEVSGIHDIFVRGDVLCATIHRFRPDLIPEYPFPPDIEEGVEALDLPAFRNQIAFDFLLEEYGLQPVVTGYNSVQYTMTHIEDLIFYLYKVFKTFHRRSDSISHAQDETSTDDTVPNVPQSDDSPPKSSNLTRSATFCSSSRIISNPQDSRNGSSIQKLQERFQGLHSQPTEVREARQRRMREAEKCKMKAMEFISGVQERKSEAEKEAIANRRDRIARSIRAVHVTKPESEAGTQSPSTTKENDDFFNEYNMRLWRKSVPSMQERKGKLEIVFAPPLSTTASCSNMVAEAPKAKPRMSKINMGPGKVNTSDWVMDLLAQKFSGSPAPKKTKERPAPILDDAKVQKSDHERNHSVENKASLQVPCASQTSQSESKEDEIPLVNSEIHDFSETIDEDLPVFDSVPERVEFYPQLPKSSSVVDAKSTSASTFEQGQDEVASPANENSPAPDFDENDEEFLDALDYTELEKLEAWSGKYL